MKGLGIQIARTFIEQAGDHVADAGLAGGILRGAAAKGVFHRDQGHGGVLHEPGLDAAGGHQPLDFRRGERRRRVQGSEHEAGASSQCGTPCEMVGHERFSSRFGAVESLIR